MDIELQKQWKMTEALLRRAQSRLPAPSEKVRLQFQEAIEEASGYLDHNEFALALDSLSDAAELVPSRGSVWRDLERAAKTMQLFDRASTLRLKFEMAISRAPS
jgi:Tfp pilus assembly protein PilF